jgi:hypothetical protein
LNFNQYGPIEIGLNTNVMKSLNLIVMNSNPKPFNYDLTTLTDLIPISAGFFEFFVQFGHSGFTDVEGAGVFQVPH